MYAVNARDQNFSNLMRHAAFRILNVLQRRDLVASLTAMLLKLAKDQAATNAQSHVNLAAPT